MPSYVWCCAVMSRQRRLQANRDGYELVARGANEARCCGDALVRRVRTGRRPSLPAVVLPLKPSPARSAHSGSGVASGSHEISRVRAQVDHSRLKEISKMTPRFPAQTVYMSPVTRWQRPTRLVQMHVHVDLRDPDVILVTRDPEGPHAIPVIPTSKAHRFYGVLREWRDDVAHSEPVDAAPVISEMTVGAGANHPAAVWRAQHGHVPHR